VIDGFSKYCSLRLIRKKSTEDTIRALSLVFEQMGKPRRIIADRAAAFTSLTFQNYLADQEVQLHHIATGMPRGNGQVERLMRTVFNLLRASLTAENEKNWVHEISVIENNINATVAFSPSQHLRTTGGPARAWIRDRDTKTKKGKKDLHRDIKQNKLLLMTVSVKIYENRKS
jgi:transposase InsO family protein